MHSTRRTSPIAPDAATALPIRSIGKRQKFSPMRRTTLPALARSDISRPCWRVAAMEVSTSWWMPFADRKDEME